MKTIGIVAHSAEGAALCYLTACREGGVKLGPHMHPTIVMSSVPMALSLPGYESGNHKIVAEVLSEGIELVAKAGADFFVCPDNTAHIVLEPIAAELPIPGLHIAEVVCREIMSHGWQRVGLLGTKYTMTGPVYQRALAQRGLERIVPDEPVREQLNTAIFDELCQAIFNTETAQRFVDAIEDLKARGAECVILGCTEIPLIVTETNSPLPILDSTRLLAKYAVTEAMSDRPIEIKAGWLPIG
jgi:aspartate racemase